MTRFPDNTVEHQQPAEEGPRVTEDELWEVEPPEREYVNRKALSPKVGYPAFALAVYTAVLATLAWQGVTVPEEVSVPWGAVITIAVGWKSPRD